MLCGAAAGSSYTDELRDMPPASADSLLLGMTKSVSESDLMHGRRPQFTQRPPLEINVIEGEPLTLRCAVEGSPKPIGMRLFRPAGTVVPGGLMFCCGFFLSFLWHFAALYLRDGWGDRPETFTYDWKCGHLDVGGLKFGGLPPKNGAKCFRGKISKPPRSIATKLCQTM